MNKEKAEAIVKNIIADIEDRRGLGNEWEMIDEEIQDEIKDQWIGIILAISSDT